MLPRGKNSKQAKEDSKQPKINSFFLPQKNKTQEIRQNTQPNPNPPSQTNIERQQEKNNVITKPAIPFNESFQAESSSSTLPSNTNDFDLDIDELELELENNNNNNNSHSVTRKRLKKYSELEEDTALSIADIKGIDQYRSIRHHFSKTKINPKDDSDGEDLPADQPQIYLEQVQNFSIACIHIGIRLKLLANVYLRKVDKTANIFLPRYIMEFHEPNSEKQSDFFRTPKGEICVFASGGLQNVWEKTVAHVLRAFNLGGKVKIIRATWIQKHLFKDKNIRRDIEEEFKGKETELHSEFFYDIFFRHFFLSAIIEKQHNLKSLTIHGYSWWDVCNDCEKYLSAHQALLNNDITLSYKIATSRRYQHHYSPHSLVQNIYIPPNFEPIAWQLIWAAVMKYVRKEFTSAEEKETFWTKTKIGLEICKWLGQAFVENKISSNNRKAKAQKKGDILKFYANVKPEEDEELQNLLSYLQDKNWDLSCWYKPPRYPNQVQNKWKKYWRQIVMPHFGWEVVFEDDNCVGEPECEMCGYQDIHNVSLIFHPKFRVSNTFFSQPSQEQAMRVSEEERRLAFKDLPLPLKQKRKQSLSVGSECVKVLCSTREDIDEWRQTHTSEELNAKWEELDNREANNEALDNAERELRKRSRTLRQ